MKKEKPHQFPNKQLVKGNFCDKRERSLFFGDKFTFNPFFSPFFLKSQLNSIVNLKFALNSSSRKTYPFKIEGFLIKILIIFVLICFK